MLAATTKEALKKGKEFWTSEKTLSELTSNNYLGSDIEGWPEVLRRMLTASVVPKAKSEYDLCISALGAVIW